VSARHFKGLDSSVKKSARENAGLPKEEKLMMRRLLSATVMLVLLVTTCAYAQRLDDLPQYKGDRSKFGEIRIWGNDGEVNLLRLWQVGFHEHNPGVKWVDYLASTAAAIGPLYTGVADLALMGRSAVPMETQAFQRFFGYEPLEIVVATGTYDTDATPGTVIYLNKQNPLSKLTLKQLDGIFGSQRTGGWHGMNWSTESARSSKENIRTWGQLGLTGEWADKPIHIYGYDLTVNGFAYSFQAKVLQGGDTWNQNLREFPLTEPGRAGAVSKSGAYQMMDALAADPYGIAYGAIKYGKGNAQVKPVALAVNDGGTYVEPTKENFINWTYPLIEPVCIYINRVPGKPVDPKVKEFLRYILSQQGQKDVVQDGSYLPLTAEIVQKQLRKLE
jgi:phosphate transport system substrate-binding protein